MASFNDMDFGDRKAALVSALSAQGITAPLPVQTEAVPRLLSGGNLVVQAPTGTGKTLAYLLPALARIDAEKLQALFRGALGKENLEVKLESLGDADMSAMVTEDEQMRRYKEMSRLYGQSFPMPDHFTLVLNRRNETVQAIAGRDPEDETTKMICQQIYDLAYLSYAQLPADEMTKFVERSNKIMELLAK